MRDDLLSWHSSKTRARSEKQNSLVEKDLRPVADANVREVLWRVDKIAPCCNTQRTTEAERSRRSEREREEKYLSRRARNARKKERMARMRTAQQHELRRRAERFGLGRDTEAEVELGLESLSDFEEELMPGNGGGGGGGGQVRQEGEEKKKEDSKEGGGEVEVGEEESAFWGLRGRWKSEKEATGGESHRPSPHRDMPRGQPSSRSKSSPATSSNVPDRYVRVLIDLATDPQRLSAMPSTYEAYL